MVTNTEPSITESPADTATDVMVGFDVVLHLHSLQDHYGVAVVHLVANLDIDSGDGAGER